MEIINTIIDKYSPYCSECSACGEEGCCSPLMCNQSEEGHHCAYYLRTLKYTYELHEAFIKHLYENEDANKDIIEQLNKIDDVIYAKYYEKQSNS